MITLLLMAMAINGGLYVGTIAYSAYISAKMDKTIEIFHNSLPTV